LSRQSRTLITIIIAVAMLFSCKGKEKPAEPDVFSFVVYPGSRYLGQLTDTTKQAHKVANPAIEPPATAIYDTEASVEAVARHYATEYGYGEIVEPPAGSPPLNATWRTGDLATDAQAIAPLLQKMNLPTDVSKAQGTYRAAELVAKPNRPRVTIQRPYFDVLTSQVVDRTLILMSR
jgi:hypothetical protein